MLIAQLFYNKDLYLIFSEYYMTHMFNVVNLCCLSRISSSSNFRYMVEFLNPRVPWGHTFHLAS